MVVMRVNWTLTISLALAIILGGIVLHWFLQGIRSIDERVRCLTSRPKGTVGFAQAAPEALP